MASHHGIAAWPNFYPGTAAVAAFFVISGFSMTKLIRARFPTTRDIPAFYVERCARILPQMWIYIAATFIANAVLALDASPTIWLNGCDNNILVALNFAIFPLQFDRFGSMESCLLVPQAWSLGVELMFYALFPFILRYRLRLLALLASMVVFVLGSSLHIPVDLFTIKLLPASLFMFICGSYIADIPDRRAKVITAAVFAVCAVVFIRSIVFVSNQFPISVSLGLVLGIPMVAYLSRIAPSQIDKLMGEISYGTFLNHILIIWIFRTITGHQIDILTLCVTSIALGWLTSFIEKPFIFLRKRPHTSGNRPIAGNLMHVDAQAMDRHVLSGECLDPRSK